MTTTEQKQPTDDPVQSPADATPQASMAAPVLDIPGAISVGDLAAMMRVTAVDVIKQLMRRGHMYAINEVIDFNLAADIAESDWSALGEDFELSGGSIKNAALRAAFYAAEAEKPGDITFDHLWDAATAETRDLGKLIRD